MQSISKITQTKMTIRDSNSDIMSEVPGNILEEILIRLHIQDAVRTSLLSRKWRYAWVKLPQLVFDYRFYKDLHRKANVLMIIYQVMLLHRGPIIKFALSLDGLESCSEIDPLILFVSNNPIQDFELCIRKGEIYKLPSSLYSCLQLKRLNLRSCMFKPPPGFGGFTRLLSLCLCEVVIADEVLSSLISSCPLLEKLILEISTSLDSLEVVGPNIKSVDCYGHFRSIFFTNTSRLEDVGLYSEGIRNDVLLSEGEISSSAVLLDSVPAIESLGLDYSYVKGIAASGVPTRLPTPLNNLKCILLIDFCFGERDEVSVLICLIRSSPNLKEIHIRVFPSDPAAICIGLDFLEMYGWSDVSLNQLRKVDIESVYGTKPEQDFIKFLLAKSPMLETMLIRLNVANVDDKLRVVRELTRFRRASPQAEMEFEC